MIQTMGFGTIKIYFIIQAQHTESAAFTNLRIKTKNESSSRLRKSNKNVLI